MSAFQSATRPIGNLGLQIIRKEKHYSQRLINPIRALDTYYNYYPTGRVAPNIGQWKRATFTGVYKGLWRYFVAKSLGIPTWMGSLWLQVIRADGTIEDYGLASTRVVTDAAVDFIVDAFQNTTEVELFNYHGIGTGTTGAAVGDTDIETEIVSTKYTGNVRATGTQGENGTNVYQSDATNTIDEAGALAITEHGVLTSATVGSGTLLDRHTFAALNIDNGDSIKSTYELTVSAGG